MRPVEGAVIAAAGLGSRLGLGLPKAMLEIEGRTVLSRLIDALEPLVPRIHVVVGYREELIIEHCARHHRSVVIVRNPLFRTTNTARSVTIGARGFGEKVLFLDGDLVVSPSSLASFVERAAEGRILVGTTPAKSEQAVFVDTRPSGAEDREEVVGFSRTTRTDSEWANVFAAPPDILDGVDGYIFEHLAQHLPLPAKSLNLSEVDTPADLEVARRFVERGFTS